MPGLMLQRALELVHAQTWDVQVPRNPGQMYKILSACQDNISRWEKTCLTNVNMQWAFPKGFHSIPLIIRCFSQKSKDRQGIHSNSCKLFSPLSHFPPGIMRWRLRLVCFFSSGARTWRFYFYKELLPCGERSESFLLWDFGVFLGGRVLCVVLPFPKATTHRGGSR